MTHTLFTLPSSPHSHQTLVLAFIYLTSSPFISPLFLPTSTLRLLFIHPGTTSFLLFTHYRSISLLGLNYTIIFFSTLVHVSKNFPWNTMALIHDRNSLNFLFLLRLLRTGYRRTQVKREKWDEGIKWGEKKKHSDYNIHYDVENSGSNDNNNHNNSNTKKGK